MPTTKVIKPKPEEPGRTLERPSRPVRVKAAESELRVPAVRKTRASSCSRCPARAPNASATSTSVSKEVQRGPASKPGCERRSRSTSAAPKPAETWSRAHVPESRKLPAVNPKCREVSACPPQKEQRGVRAETRYTSQSYKAFTVIAPNPKKRREIQRKAEAELAALEELRLSRAMAYVSINPSSVGGCMSLEEVRSKQQQEMMQAKRQQQRAMKKQVMEETPVLTS